MEIVLFEPEIPQNTGSIARTCAATGTPLHLVGKLGFDISEKAVRRAGLDYWPYVSLQQHETFDDYLNFSKPERIWLFEPQGKAIYHEAKFQERDALIFGRKTTGLPREIIDRFDNSVLLQIPIVCSGVRSLNLSNAVAVALYEAIRQVGFPRGLNP